VDGGKRAVALRGKVLGRRRSCAALGGSECYSGSYGGNKVRTKQRAPKDIDEYIAGFPNDVQEILEKIRMKIRKRHRTQKKQSNI